MVGSPIFVGIGLPGPQLGVCSPLSCGGRYYRLYSLGLKLAVVLVAQFVTRRGAEFAGLVVLAALHFSTAASLAGPAQNRPYQTDV